MYGQGGKDAAPETETRPSRREFLSPEAIDDATKHSQRTQRYSARRRFRNSGMVSTCRTTTARSGTRGFSGAGNAQGVGELQTRRPCPFALLSRLELTWPRVSVPTIVCLSSWLDTELDTATGLACLWTTSHISAGRNQNIFESSAT